MQCRLMLGVCLWDVGGLRTITSVLFGIRRFVDAILGNKFEKVRCRGKQTIEMEGIIEMPKRPTSEGPLGVSDGFQNSDQRTEGRNCFHPGASERRQM